MTTFPAQDVILEYFNTGIDRYPVTFEYDDVDQVVVRAWDPLTNEYISPMIRGDDYVFDGPTTIVFTGTPPDQFVILRNTDISQSYGTSRFSRFAQGNAIRASDLNGNLELLRMAIQETQGSSDDNTGDITDLENKLDQEIIDRIEGDENLQNQIDDIETNIDNIENDINNIQSGKVTSVTATAPVVSSGGINPDISMPPASSTEDGYMSKEDKAKLDAAGPGGTYFEVTDYPEIKFLLPVDADKGLQLPDETSGATYEEQAALRYNTGSERLEVHDGSSWQGVSGGAEIQTGPPANAAPGDLWWDSEDGRGYVYYDDGDSKQWVESNPSWNGSIPDDAIDGDKLADGSVSTSKLADGSVTPPKLSTGGPSWDTSGNLSVSGGAEFAGNITAGDYPNPTSYISASSLYANANPKTATVTNSGVAVYQDGANNGQVTIRNTDGDDNIVLYGGTGSATFADRLNVGGISLSGYEDGAGLWSDGYVTASGPNDDSTVFVGYKTSNGTLPATSTILANGSAKFAGDVTIGSTTQEVGVGSYYLTAAGYGKFDRTFTGANNKPTGYIYTLCNTYIDPDGTGTNPKPLCLTGGNATAATADDATWYIASDGSATFAGGVTFNNSTKTGEGTEIRSNQVIIRKDSSGGALAIYNGGDATANRKIDLRGDGSAEFAGNIDAGNVFFKLEPDNDDNYTVTTEEYTETESYTGPLGNTLEREVTKTNEIRTYTGPTLDVKDRLLNLISRLDALEADEIIDDSNSSALLQLVHNLSARLDLRDQQIADLTQRIQTLELQ